MLRDRGVGWPSVGDQYGSRGKMQATNQHSGALLRGRKGKGGNKGIDTIFSVCKLWHINMPYNECNDFCAIICNCEILLCH
jgi:hypothetical protein